MRQRGGLVYHIKRDIRQEKSAERIMVGAMHLLLQNPKAPLTIQGICKECGSSRSTFYRLFDGTDDVIYFWCERFFRGILEICAENERTGISYDPFRLYAEHFSAHTEELAAILQQGKIGLIMEANRRNLIEFADVLFPEMDTHSSEFTFFVEMRSSVIVGAWKAWLETGQSASIDEVVEYSRRQLRYFNREWE